MSNKISPVINVLFDISAEMKNLPPNNNLLIHRPGRSIKA